MKKLLLLCLSVIISVAFSACNQAPSNTDPSTTQKVQPCAVHSFVGGSPTCVVCGMDYMETVLDFRLTEAGDSYAVTGIGSFSGKSVVIPATYLGFPVTEIADSAFSAEASNVKSDVCAKITEVHLPKSIVRIGNSAFYNCKALKTVILESGVVEIGDDAFYKCTALENIDLPNTVRHIGAKAFAYCNALTDFVIPEGVVSLGEGIFLSCNALETISVSGSVTAIPDRFARSCRKLHTVDLGGNIQSIGNEAFWGVDALTAIDLGEKLESIGESAFGSLETVNLPDTLRHLGEGAFCGCTFRNVRIPQGIETIGDKAFLHCDSLELNAYEGMGYLGNEENPYLVLVCQLDADARDVVTHENTKIVLDTLFSESEIDSLTIGRNVAYISTSGLVKQKNLEINVATGNKSYRVVDGCLIETQTKILRKAFKAFSIPSDGSVIEVGRMSCQYLEDVTIVIIPDSVVYIGHHAFSQCPNLKELIIGSGVERIDMEILIGSEGIGRVYYHGTETQWKQVEIAGRDTTSMIGGNKTLLSTPIYFYSETPPTEPGNYWHYVDGVPTPWEEADT